MANDLRRIGKTVFASVMLLMAAAISGINNAHATIACPPEVEWQSIYDSCYLAFDGRDYYEDVCTDSKGNVYVCGREECWQEMRNGWRVEKFDKNGNSLWVDIPSSSGSIEYYAAHSIATTPSGGVVVVGGGPFIFYSTIIVRKYDGDGNVLWTYTRTGNGEISYGMGVAVNDVGEIYVAGRTVYGKPDRYIRIKLDQYGKEIWLKSSEPASWNIRGMAVFPNGDVLAANDSTLMRFGPSGDIKWTWQYDLMPGTPILDVAIDAERKSFFAMGSASGVVIAKFPDEPEATEAVAQWTNYYPEGLANAIAFDNLGYAYVTGSIDGLWAIWQFGDCTSNNQPPELICTTRDENWILGEDSSYEPPVESLPSYGGGIACTRDGGIVSCGMIVNADHTSQGYDAEVVKFHPHNRNGAGPGPVASSSPTEPGPEHPGGLKPGDVSVAGGSAGYVDPRGGQGASISVYPTSAGTVTLTVIDRKGGVVKQVSAAASGTGAVALTWDGKNDSGAPVAPGIYAVRVEGPGVKQVSKVAVVY